MPVSMKSMRMAVSRRSSKVFPEHEANHVRRSPWFTTSTGWSVSCGGDIFAIGDEGISPSSSSHRKYCWRHR